MTVIPAARHLHLVGAFDYPPPCDIESIDTLSDPIVGDDLSAAAGIYSWVGIGLVAWIVTGGLYWVLR